jgi:hypothetical protein
MAHEIRFVTMRGPRDGFMFAWHDDLGNIGNGCRIRAQRCSSTAAKAARVRIRGSNRSSEPDVRICNSNHSGAMTRNRPMSGINGIRHDAGQRAKGSRAGSPGSRQAVTAACWRGNQTIKLRFLSGDHRSVASDEPARRLDAERTAIVP